MIENEHVKLTTEELISICHRLSGITPPPWDTWPKDGRYGGRISSVGPAKTSPANRLHVCDIRSGGTSETQAQDNNNAILIAHAPVDIANLLTEVEAWRASSADTLDHSVVGELVVACKAALVDANARCKQANIAFADRTSFYTGPTELRDQLTAVLAKL